MSRSPEPGVVRAAVAADAAALAALDKLVNPSPWSETQFAGACCTGADSLEQSLIMELDGQLQGFVVFSRVLDEACIHNIAVLPSLQGVGLGYSLLGAALSRSRAAGATRCYLEVRASNEPARRLYEKLGFQLDGVRRNYYSRAAGREDALLMSRQLAEQES